MSNIFITPASISDAPTFFQLASEAFTDDDLYQHGQSCCKTPEHRKAYQDWRTQLYVETMTGSNKHSYKAVDHNSGKVVGFVILHGPVSAEEKRKGKRYENVPRFMDRDFYEALGEGFKKMRGDVLGDEEAKSWFVRALVVLSEFQGKGIASQLLQYGMETVETQDGERHPHVWYVESSPVAKRLYRRFGFEEKAEFPVLDGKYVSTAMVRRPTH